ncbi:hypothetical protein PAMP_000329 [Pampus punctatissimus]
MRHEPYKPFELGIFDGRFLTFYQMQAAIFAAAPRMSSAQCCCSFLFFTQEKKTELMYLQGAYGVVLKCRHKVRQHFSF